MPNTRPTPGPWEIRPFGYPVAEDGMWVPQIGAEVHPYADVVARVGVLGGRRAPERVVADARYIVACANAVFRLAEHLGLNPLEVAEGLDLVAMMRQRDEARRETERLRERLDALAAHFDAEASFAYGGWQEEKDDYLEGVYRAFRHAAEKVRDLAASGQEGETT